MLAAWKNYSFSPQLAGPSDTPEPICETEQHVSAQLCSWSAFFTPPFPAAVLGRSVMSDSLRAHGL